VIKNRVYRYYRSEIGTARARDISVMLRLTGFMGLVLGAI